LQIFTLAGFSLWVHGWERASAEDSYLPAAIAALRALALAFRLKAPGERLGRPLGVDDRAAQSRPQDA
jgi:hypothetical protein